MIGTPGSGKGNFSEAMKEMESLVIEKLLAHGDNPVFNWMVSNVTAKIDKKDNIFPNKEFPDNKIDGAVAAIMAIGRIKIHIDARSIYETRGILTFGGQGAGA